MGRSLTATRRARRTSADSRSSTCPRARRRWSGLPRSPSPAAALKRSASSCPTRRWAIDRSPIWPVHAHGSEQNNRLCERPCAWLGALAQRRTDVDHAFVLDRDEVGADSHRHFLDVCEDLVADLLRVVADADLDADLVHRPRIEPGLA